MKDASDTLGSVESGSSTAFERAQGKAPAMPYPPIEIGLWLELCSGFSVE